MAPRRITPPAPSEPDPPPITPPAKPLFQFGTLNEKSLHIALKQFYAVPGDRFEVPLGGFLIDIVRGDLLIEIQTRSVTAIRRKLAQLAAVHPVRLVYPIAREKWIVKLPADAAEKPRRRKSPKRGSVEHLFTELVSIPALLAHPNFSLEILLIQEEEVCRQGVARNWRRKGWGTHERRLLAVVDRHLFQTPADLAALLPPALPCPFSTADLAETLARPRWLAQKMAYCLRALGLITPAGKQRNAILYTRVKD